MKKFVKRILKELKNDAIYKRKIDKDGTLTIYCDSTFTVWKKDKGSSDFDIVAPFDTNLRHCKLRVNNGDIVELVTEGNFSVDFLEVPPRIEIPSGEKLLELVENKPDNIKDLVRAQVLAEISAYNVENGGESLEEFDDFSEMEDEFNDAPLAHAEMQLMQEEFEQTQRELDSSHNQPSPNLDGQTSTGENPQAPADSLEANKTDDSVKESSSTATS